ncbi:hypothetical protein GJAV_G00112810 [Gymnothorax javanicus]|nr:hypothetical protein GJAV_G00112810 [Gymnothorax javanicus]
MGRSYIVDDLVEKYLINLQSLDLPFVTGLLIGQIAVQKDYVLLATRTPPREKEPESKISSGSTAVTSLDGIDVQWVSEHAKQVSQMLPGGLSVLGVFLIHPPDLTKEAQNTLRRLLFAVEKCISKGRLWKIPEEDVSDRVMLQICSKTRKAVCRTFDVMDPKCSAKPADWKYQSGVSGSWLSLQCCVSIDLVFPISATSSESMDKCTKEGLLTWAKRIESGICLIDGKRLADDFDVTTGLARGRKNVKASQPKLRCQIIIPAGGLETERRTTATMQPCSGVLAMKGAVHCRAYMYTGKPRAGQAIEAIKRDVMNTVSCRTELLFEDLIMNKGTMSSQQPLPRRVFAPVPGSAVCVCDYMFADESMADVRERFKEMLDCDIPEESIDTSQEAAVENPSNFPSEETMDMVTPEIPAEASKRQKSFQPYIGVAVAAGFALLATGMSLLYLSD